VESNNLDINETKTLSYKDIKLKKGDIIRATLFVRFAKKDCLKVIDLKDEKFKRAEVIKTKEYIYSPLELYRPIYGSTFIDWVNPNFGWDWD